MLDLLQRDNHVIAPLQRVVPESGPVTEFRLVGRNDASTFTGLCSKHDLELFKTADTEPLDVKNAKQLNELAYRAVMRELHSCVEMSFALQAISDLNCAFRIDSEIVPLSDHVPGPAAELCVRASAQHLRDIAWMRPDLRRAMPELRDTSSNSRSDIDSDTLMLRHFVGRPDPVLRNDHAQLVAEARQVLDRLDSFASLAEEDEAALSTLGR